MTVPGPPAVAVIVAAAGEGTRLGADVPKAFVELAGRTLLEHALHSVFGMDAEPQVIVAAPPDRMADAEAIGEAFETAEDRMVVVAGGKDRQTSVAAALDRLAPSVRTVLVHDAARALTPVSLLNTVVAEAERLGHGVVPGLPLADTVKRTDAAGGVHETVDRSTLRAVQTPQGFPRERLAAAYAAADRVYTDDAAVYSAAGGSVTVIPGSPLAFKITGPEDLARAGRILAPVAGPDARTGIGVDSHAVDPARPLWLAGLHWPDEPGLAGHSDGDAVCHAIADALLAAAGLGDLGSVFGTADPAYVDAHGTVFLARAADLLRENGFAVSNVSVQLIAARPRFAVRRTEAERLLTDALAAPVSVSATTTDGLGFTGRGEGVAAIASALVHRVPRA